jgi:hypothetical protein
VVGQADDPASGAGRPGRASAETSGTDPIDALAVDVLVAFGERDVAERRAGRLLHTMRDDETFAAPSSRLARRQHHRPWRVRASSARTIDESQVVRVSGRPVDRPGWPRWIRALADPTALDRYRSKIVDVPDSDCLRGRGDLMPLCATLVCSNPEQHRLSSTIPRPPKRSPSRQGWLV